MDLFERVRKLVSQIETAAPEAGETEILEYHQDVIEGVINYYEGLMDRANAMLDKNKEKVFVDVLSLTTRGQVERAMRAYSKSYLLSLAISIEATSELAKELILLAKKYKLEAPKDWIDVAEFNTSIGRIRTKLPYVREAVEM